jgi:hypothetical protein
MVLRYDCRAARFRLRPGCQILISRILRKERLTIRLYCACICADEKTGNFVTAVSKFSKFVLVLNAST